VLSPTPNTRIATSVSASAPPACHSHVFHWWLPLGMCEHDAVSSRRRGAGDKASIHHAPK